MKTVVEMAAHPEIARGYRDEFTVQRHIVWMMKHLDSMDDNGLLLHPDHLEDGWNIPVAVDQDIFREIHSEEELPEYEERRGP